MDYIITHTGPYEVVAEMGYSVYDDEDGENQLKVFQQIADKVDFKDWFFGHFHEDVDIENFHCFFDEIIDLDVFE